VKVLLMVVLAVSAPDAGIARPSTSSGRTVSSTPSKPDGGTVLLARPVKISADTLDVFGKEHRAVYSGHAKAVRDSTTLTCDQLTVFYAEDQSVSRIEAHGHVLAVDDHREAGGDDATYDNATGVLVVTGNPQAKSAGRRVTGTRVVFTTGIDRVEVENPRSVVDDAGKHAKGERMTIDADRLVLDQQKSEATWTGNVRATKTSALLTAPRLIAYYDEQGEVTRVDARGGVEVKDADKWARGQRATFDNQAGLLTVTGNPEARQGPNRMRGSRVTFTAGSERLVVDDATTIIDASEKRKK
jgi:lipopolysaccharide transport protein LptA